MLSRSKGFPTHKTLFFLNGWKIPFTTITSFKATIRDLRGIWPHNRVIHNRDPSWPIRTTPYSDDEVFAQSDDHLCNTRAPRNRAFTSQESKSKRCCECEIAKHINGHYIPITRGCRRSPVESGCRKPPPHGARKGSSAPVDQGIGQRKLRREPLPKSPHGLTAGESLIMTAYTSSKQRLAWFLKRLRFELRFPRTHRINITQRSTEYFLLDGFCGIQRYPSRKFRKW